MTLNQAIETAKAKAANSPAWLRAIEKASKMLASGELVVTLFADNTALVTSPNGSYRVNGACPCASRASHCYHRAAKRLVEMMETAPAEASRAVLVTNSYAGRVETPVEVVGETAKKVRIRAVTETKLGGRNRWLAPGETAFVPKSAVRTGRDALIADIKSTWPKSCPGVHLADALMARFRKNQLEMLDDDMLRRVRLAIAM